MVLKEIILKNRTYFYTKEVVVDSTIVFTILMRYSESEEDTRKPFINKCTQLATAW